jgi:hypothetical protein
MHNDAIHTFHCPIRSLVRRVSDVLAFTTDLDTPLSAYCAQGRTRHVLSSHINTAVKSAARALKLHLCGFTPDLVSSHSLRAGGAMAMKLNGEGRDTIRKQGRWSSDTFLMYIHEQIAAFSTGISWSRISRLQNRVLSLIRHASNTSKTYYAQTTLFLPTSRPSSRVPIRESARP